MPYLHLSDQVMTLVMICFSFTNMVFVLTMYPNKDFHKLLGLSFIIPFSFGFSSLLYPNLMLGQSLVRYAEVLFFLLIIIELICWKFQKYSLGILFILSLPVVAFLHIVIFRPNTLILGSYLLTAIVFIGTILIIIFSQKLLKNKHQPFIWGIGLLGVSLGVAQLIPQEYYGIVVFGKICGYILLFVHIQQQVHKVYHAKLKTAQVKLADVDKTIHYEVKKKTLEIEIHNEHLRNMIHVDPLVNAYNKKGILNFMREMIEDEQHFTILLFDLDNFKAINDQKGHLEGDRVLKRITQIARENIRDCDRLGRYGGDEFLIVLPNASISDAIFIADRFRKKVQAEPNISVSIGVAAFPEDGITVHKMIKFADFGLYESKKKGKNAVTHYQIQSITAN